MILITDSMSVGMPPPSIIDKLQEYVDDNPEIEQLWSIFCYDTYMKSRLIIIRGNSGSGKSTVARLVRDKLGVDTMLIPQDVVRRDMLFVKDRLGNPAIELIPKIALYGKEIGYDVVLEGILSKKLYGVELRKLITDFEDNAYVFYMDVSFEETLKRHDTKPKRLEYGREKMQEWWLDNDILGTPLEYIIPESYSADQAVDFILSKVMKSPKLFD